MSEKIEDRRMKAGADEETKSQKEGVDEEVKDRNVEMTGATEVKDGDADGQSSSEVCFAIFL